MSALHDRPADAWRVFDEAARAASHVPSTRLIDHHTAGAVAVARAARAEARNAALDELDDFAAESIAMGKVTLLAELAGLRARLVAQLGGGGEGGEGG